MGPAPTAPLTEAGEMPSLSGLTEASEYLLEQYVNTTVLPWTGDEFRDILAIIEGDAIARHREQADAEVARLKAAIPEDPWVWLSRRQPGHARCYACDASWSLSQGHEPDCRWVSARSVK